MKIIYFLISILFLAWVDVLITDTKLLVSEARVRVGEKYFISDYGNLGDSKQDSLVCKYFNGRKFIIKVFWYSPNNIFGKDGCPFLLKD